jgi:hypothetical protein
VKHPDVVPVRALLLASGDHDVGQALVTGVLCDVANDFGALVSVVAWPPEVADLAKVWCGGRDVPCGELFAGEVDEEADLVVVLDDAVEPPTDRPCLKVVFFGPETVHPRLFRLEPA